MPFFRWLSRHYGDYLLGCGIKACDYCFGKRSQYSVVHNAISLDRFRNVSASEIDYLKEKLGVEGKFVIGHVGLFCPPKNHTYILKILDYVLKDHPETVLILIGGGELKESIEKESEKLGINKYIRFEGVQKNIPAYMHVFNTFILPSLHEGLPVCGIEAQAVVSNVCFSDTIDRDVDAGVGSASFIPITEEALPLWQKAIFEPKDRLDEETIKKRFIEHGYEIKYSVETLFNIYKEVANKKK